MKKVKKALSVLIIACMFISITACGKKETIRIASKPMTEQYVLTEIMKALIEEKTDYKVEITKGVGGGTTNIHPALLKGDFDLYPEYTRSAWLNVLKKDMEKDDEKLYNELQAGYNELALEWVGLYGYSNTYGLAVRQETAEQYGLKTYSDLTKVSGELVFGGNPDYIELETGYPRLCEAFKMQFKNTVQMEIALKYQALVNQEVDVINAFTTDAQLAANDLVLLEDDGAFFETYLAGTVVRQDALKKYPALKETLMLMNGLITENEMQKMNYEVEVNGKEDAAVAKEFLQGKGLIQ